MKNLSQVFQKNKQKKNNNKTNKQKQHMNRLSFITQFMIEFSLPFTGCRKVFGKKNVCF